MKHKIFDNWGLKLGSVLFALILWLVVTNINDPTTSLRISNVKVKFLNTNVITDTGKVYEVEDGTDIVDTVTIRAPRSIIDSLGSENVYAEADFRNLTAANTVPITFGTNKYNSQLESIKGNFDSVQLTVETKQSKTLALSTVTSGTVNEGYMIGDITADENQIRISGPESLIDQVVRAEASVSVTGFTQDIITDADIVLMDAEGNTIRSSTITSNINSVRVKVEMLQTKRVGLNFTTTGVPADGYEATGTITCDPETILVAGKSSVLSSIESIDIDEPINITGQAGDMQVVIDVGKYLQNSIKLADSTFNGNVTVTVSIQEVTTRTLRLNASDIVWENVPEGYRVEIVDPEGSYNVSVRGLSQNLSVIDENGIQAVADLEGILEQEDRVGENYHVTLDFNYDGKPLKIASAVQVWFVLAET